MIPRPYQQEAIDQLYRWWVDHPGIDQSPLLVLPTGCHSKGTRVVMIDGSTKTVENVIVGDVLLGPDSTPRNVIRVVFGKETMNRITPLRGGLPFIVNDSHVLSLMTTNEGKEYKSTTVAGTVEAISVSDYKRKSKSWRHLRKLHRAGVVSFSEKDAPIFDPWALGALLGDGSLKYGVNFTSPDVDILDALLSVMRSHGLDFSKSTYSTKVNVDCWHVRFVDELANRSTENRVTALLKKVGVYGTTAESKFIPAEYKTGSVETRANVLAGLLDTDGHYDCRGGYDFVSKSPVLANDLAFVARSLGITASVKECEKYCQNGGGGIYYRVHLSGNLSWLPMRCGRKKSAARGQKKNPRVTGFSVEPIGVGEFYGFTLDGDHLYLTDDFFVHHNSGKSIVIAELVRLLFDTWPDDQPRTVVLVPSKELAEQNADKLARILPSHISIGYYSASLGKKCPTADVIVATIGSIAKNAHILGNIRCVMIDEAHLVNPDGAGQYRQFLNDLAKYCVFRVVGLTATPFRGNGVWLTSGKDPLFCGIAHTVKVQTLLDSGHVSPLVRPSDVIKTRIDTDEVSTLNGDFAIDELSDCVGQYLTAAAEEAVTLAADRKKWIAFLPTVANAGDFVACLHSLGVSAALVCGETPKKDRERLIAEFRAGRIRCLVTVLALAVGFDVPDVDCIVWLRPTKSPVLYVQGSGRGMRICEGKTDCLWLDFSDTTDRLGPVDAIKGRRKSSSRDEQGAPFAVCGECGAQVRPANSMTCQECGAVVREEEAKEVRKASDAPIMLHQVQAKIVRYEVTRVTYHEHHKDGSPDSMRVEYWSGLRRVACEWICVEHKGFARGKALQWWKGRMAYDIPNRAAICVDACKIAAIKPSHIIVNESGKFPEIIKCEFEQKQTA